MMLILEEKLFSTYLNNFGDRPSSINVGHIRSLLIKGFLKKFFGDLLVRWFCKVSLSFYPFFTLIYGLLL